jgi:transposase
MKHFTLAEFNEQFPDDSACLEFVFKARWPKPVCPDCGKADCFYRVESRKCYSCSWCGYQLSPTAGTIFHKSETSLKSWFFAMFLMSASRNGVAAKELERQLGVTYKTAWRMAHQIRKLMDDDGGMLKGVVEADETYYGGKRPGKRGRGAAGKTPIVGIVERGGKVKAKVVNVVTTANCFGNIIQNVERGSTVHTDELPVYNYAGGYGYKHEVINHGRKEYVRGACHTNTIEGFWAQLKRSIDGTHHSVSRKYLQRYVNEFSYRYNRRSSVSPMFSLLSATVGKQLCSTVRKTPSC